MSPILLDLQTLSFVLILVTAFLTFVMVFVWLTQKTYAGFGFWVVSNIAIQLGILLQGIEGIWTDVIGTSLAFAAVLIGYEGIRQFLKLKNTYVFSISLFVVQFGVLLAFKFGGDNVILQVCFTSLLVGCISGICGFLFTGSSVETTRFLYRFTGITYFIFAAIMIVRSIGTYYTGDNVDFYKPDGIQPIFFILYILFEIIWTFNYINLNTNRLYNELEQTKTELEHLATTDFLTGINNRRKFLEIGEHEIQRAKRFQYQFSVIMFDIDHFKQVNDDYGHAGGDKALVEIAEILQKLLRLTDTLGRLGGEEFGILLPYTNIQGAKIVADHFRTAIEEIEVKFASQTIKVTASFGVTELIETDEQMEDLLDRADELLYKAKNRGRNRVVSRIKEKTFEKATVL